MITISSSEFRTNQKSYLDQVANGMELLITRGKDAFKLSKVTYDPTLIPKDEFIDRINKSIEEVHSGKYYTMKPDESLDEFLDRMEREGNV
jgi:hypothetical protein